MCIISLTQALAHSMAEVAKRDQALAAKDEEIDALKAYLKSPLELLVKFVENKDEEIASLRTTITVVEEVSASVRVAGNYVESSSSEDTAKSDEASYEDDTDENEDPARVSVEVIVLSPL